MTPMPFIELSAKRGEPHKTILSLLVSACAALLLAGCGPSSDNSSQPRGASESPGSQSSGGGYATQGTQRQRQAEFLNRIRQADPRFNTIERAVLNDNNDLGLILSRSVEMDSIPGLMKTMLTEMNKEFPGQNLTVIAYAPTQPPRRIGTAHFNASTQSMTYTPEH